jgi:Ca2+-binding EF-hand superfamily protein
MISGIGCLFVAAIAIPAEGQDAGQTARKEKKVAAGEKEAKKLLLLMDKDGNGKVSKQEFMSFMEAEFDRLDKDKNGELDVQELTQSQVRSSGAIHR